MWRMLKVTALLGLIAMAALCGFAVVGRSGVNGAGGMPDALAAGVIGVVLGLAVAWTRSFTWRETWQRLHIWRRHLAPQAAWAAVGCLAVAILLFY